MWESIKLLEGNISSRLGELTSSVVQDLAYPKRKYKLKDLIDVLDQDPVAYACTQLKVSRASNSFGDYTNSITEIKDFIEEQLQELPISFSEFKEKAASAMPFGFFVCENIFKKIRTPKTMLWGLKNFHFLNPLRVQLQIGGGDFVSVEYTEESGEVVIPYWKCIHITNSVSTSFGKKAGYGSPELLRAYPYIKLKQLIFAEMGINAKTLATGILVGKADSNTQVQLKNEFGQPIPDGSGGFLTVSAVENLGKQFKLIENFSRIVTDKSNEISALQVPSGAGFWSMALQLCDEQIMRALLTPETVWREGSGALGVGTLSQVQLSVFDSSIISVNQQIRENLLEKVIKPLIKYNFGVVKDYGKFEKNSSDDPQNESFVLQMLFTAIGSQIIDSNDLEIQNFIRRKLGLSTTTPSEQEQKNKMKEQIMKEMENLNKLNKDQEQEIEKSNNEGKEQKEEET